VERHLQPTCALLGERSSPPPLPSPPHAAPASSNSATRHFQKLLVHTSRLLGELQAAGPGPAWHAAALRATNALVLAHVVFKFAAEHLTVERMTSLLAEEPGDGAGGGARSAALRHQPALTRSQEGCCPASPRPCSRLSPPAL